jgi:hypothetical protein
MEYIVELIKEFGSFGVLLALSGFIIYTHIKEHKLVKPATSNDNSCHNYDDLKRMLDHSIEDIKTAINSVKLRLEKLESVQHSCIVKKEAHTKQFLDRLKLGPQLHKTLNTFRTRVNADHIFIGSFHNGNESITGIPYYKFDIIAERFRPDKVEQDIEFAPMYKDADLLRHDMLPSEVVQEGIVHYVIDENESSILSDVDDILYRRMLGRDIKQLAISLLRDPSGTPSGFVGCVRYDYEKIDLLELKDCAIELECIYANNEKLINEKH